MLWYGFSNLTRVHTHTSRLNLRRNMRKQVQLRPEITPSKSFTLFALRQIVLTSEFDFIGLRRTTKIDHPTLIYLYSDVYFIHLLVSFNSNSYQFERQTSSFTFDAHAIFSQWLLYVRRFSKLLAHFTTAHFIKLRFRGKGYYLYKNFRNVITPQFGYSHRRYFYTYYASVLFLTKTKILVFGLSIKQVILLSHQLKTIRPANIFTGRGMRFSRQVVYRKVGKISTYR